MINIRCTRNDFLATLEPAVSVAATISISEKSLTIEPTQSSVSETVTEAIAIQGVFASQPRLEQ